MGYAKLFGLKNISDEELIRLITKKDNEEIHIGAVTIKKSDVSERGVSGDFGDDELNRREKLLQELIDKKIVEIDESGKAKTEELIEKV